MSGEDTELLFERAQSIVRKALSAISEDNETEGEEDVTRADHVEDVAVEDINIEYDDSPGDTVEDIKIKEAAVSVILTEQGVTTVPEQVEETEDDVVVTSSPGTDNLVSGDNLVSDQENGDYISLLSRGSTHSLRLPSVDLLQDEDEDKEETKIHETRAEFVIRKTFENFTEYAKLLNDKDRLSEKRYLQVMRELDLIGPGTNVNTTDAEMVYFNHASQRTVGLTASEFEECLYEILERNGRDIDTITEDVLYPAVSVHHYSTVFMSVK